MTIFLSELREVMPRKKKSNAGPIATIIIVVMCFFGIFGYYFMNLPIEIDNKTGCPKNLKDIENIVGHKEIAILMDTTQDISPNQKERIKNMLFDSVQSTNGFDRIKIFNVLPSDEKIIAPFFDFCKPKEQDLGNPAIQALQKNRFLKQLDKAFDQDWGKDQSPIIESISSISSQYRESNSENILVIVSDLLQYSKILDIHNDAKWKKQLTKNSKQIKIKQPDLEDWSVAFMFIPRNKSQSNRELVDWWRDYLQESGARNEDIQFNDDDNSKSYRLLAIDTITG